MDHQEFESICERQIDLTREVLLHKGQEYSDQGNRLHNFQVAAVFQGITPEEALWGMATKHFVSISDMVRRGEYYTPAMWDEKIGDAINYLFLLRAQIHETEKQSSEDPTSDISTPNAQMFDSIDTNA